MFCKFCGKEIDDNSIFCKYCGKKLNDSELYRNNKNGKTLIQRFLALEKCWQIYILSSFLWVILWFVLFYHKDMRQYYWGGEMILIKSLCLLPLIVWIIWYIWKLTIKNKASKEIAKNVIENKSDVHESTNTSSVIPLLDFAQTYGKMQIVKGTDEKGNQTRYCRFTNSEGDITKVFFDNTTDKLSAKDISIHKTNLYIILAQDSTYCLHMEIPLTCNQ